jgi:hypothetical protein
MSDQLNQVLETIEKKQVEIDAMLKSSGVESKAAVEAAEKAATELKSMGDRLLEIEQKNADAVMRGNKAEVKTLGQTFAASQEFKDFAEGRTAKARLEMKNTITGQAGSPAANSDVIDRYVIFNYLDRVWYYGSLSRTAWLDSPLRAFPQAATSENIIVLHEALVDDGSTNPPSPISAYIQSSDFDIGDGHNYGFLWRMIPDVTFDGSTTAAPAHPAAKFSMRPRQNPGSPYGVAPAPTVASTQNYSAQNSYTVQEFTEIIYTRIRGRQMAFKIESDTLGTQWQLGTPSLDVRPDGRR